MSQLIWTNHLLQRIRERDIDPSLVEKTVRFPDETRKSHTQSSYKYTKYFGSYSLVAAVKKQGNDRIITSVWKDKPSSLPYQKPLLERLIYRLVLLAENALRRRLNR